MAEKLRLQHILRRGAAVDRDERLVSPRAGVVYGACQQFLAGSALSGEQHSGIGARHHVCLGELVLHQLIARHDVGAPVLVHLRKSGHLERLLHVVEQFLFVDRFGEKAERSALGGVHGVRNRAVGGQDDHSQTRPAALQLLEQSDAVHLIHAKIGDHEVGTESRARGECRRGALHGLDLVVLGAQADGQQTQQPGVVIDHQNSRLALLRRRSVLGACGEPKAQGSGGGGHMVVHWSLRHRRLLDHRGARPIKDYAPHWLCGR